MNTLNYEILNDIDRIDQCVMEAEMNVMSALYAEYDKATMILENYEGDDIESFDIFQESFILEADISKNKGNIIKKLWNGLKAILKKFVSFLKRKCKYIGLLIKMKRNPDEEVYCPIPLKKTYSAYVEFEEYIHKLSNFVESINPEEINSAGKMNELFYRKLHQLDLGTMRPHKATPIELEDLMKEYERFDKGEKLHSGDMLIDAGNKKKTNESKMFNKDGFYNKTENLTSIKSIIDTIENLNDIRESVSKKVDSLIKIFEKFDNISSNNEYVNDVLKYFLDYKKDIIYFMKLDSTLERCLTTQFAAFLEYSDKHKSDKHKEDSQSRYNYFFPNVTFDKYIKNKELGPLKAMLCSTIGSDPTWVTTEYFEAINYIKEKSKEFHGSELDLSEPYQKQEDEYKKPREKWDEEYFRMLLVWYRKNFANERLDEIKNVGKVVFKDKLTYGQARYNNRIKDIS